MDGDLKQSLESKVAYLIRRNQILKEENDDLRKNEQALIQERDHFKKKNTVAINRIKSLLSKLKQNHPPS